MYERKQTYIHYSKISVLNQALRYLIRGRWGWVSFLLELTTYQDRQVKLMSNKKVGYSKKMHLIIFEIVSVNCPVGQMSQRNAKGITESLF